MPNILAFRLRLITLLLAGVLCGPSVYSSETATPSTPRGDVRSAQALVALPQPIRSLAVARDGKTLAFSYAGTPNGKAPSGIQLWDVQTKRLLRAWKTTKQVSPLAFTPDGRRVAGACADAKARLWDAESGKVVQVFGVKGKMPKLSTIAFSPDGQTLFGGGGNPLFDNYAGSILQWNTQTGKLERAVTAAEDIVSTLAISADGRKIAVVGVGWYNSYILGEQAVLEYSALRLYDPATSRLNPEFSVESGPEGVQSGGSYAFLSPNDNTLAFSPDGNTLAGASGKRLLLVDLTTEKVERLILAQHRKWDNSDRIDSIAFSPTGNLLASGTREGLVCLWNSQTRELVWAQQASKAPITVVAFALGGHILVSGGEDGVVRLWSIQ